MTTLKNATRWVCVLPGALVAAVAVTFPLHWAAMWVHSSDEFGLFSFFSAETVERLGDAFFVSFTFVFAGACIAPSYKFATGILLAILFAANIVFTATVLVPQYGLSNAATMIAPRR